MNIKFRNNILRSLKDEIHNFNPYVIHVEPPKYESLLISLQLLSLIFFYSRRLDVREETNVMDMKKL